MKTPRSFAFITAALIIGFLAIRWGAAQPARQLPPDEPKTDYGFGLRERHQHAGCCFAHTMNRQIEREFDELPDNALANGGGPSAARWLASLATFCDWSMAGEETDKGTGT